MEDADPEILGEILKRVVGFLSFSRLALLTRAGLPASCSLS